MKSMTGFGQAAAEVDGLSLRVELSSVNRRNLDIQCSLPRSMNALEASCVRVLQKGLARGRIQLRVHCERHRRERRVELDHEAAAELLNQLKQLASELELSPPESLAELASFGNLFQELQEEESEDQLWPLLEETLTTALQGLLDMRAQEGAHLQSGLHTLLDEIEALLSPVRELQEQSRSLREEELREAAARLVEASPELEPRLLQELAFQLERGDVREELDRIDGHLLQFREKTAEQTPVGRALDFLCQELAREFNTLSVKVSRADMKRLALTGKEKVEMLREQVQNIE